MNKTRTRFAPSPTGYMHVGNLRSALYTYLIAKIDDGTFVLRIEDTDRERYVEDAVSVIYKTMKETGLIHDEGPDVGGNYGPYVQSERGNYEEYAKQLVEKGEAYYCFCSEERLDNLRATAQVSKQPFKYDGHCKNLTAIEVEEKLKNNESYVIRQAMPTSGKTVYNDLVYGRISFDNEELEDQILIKGDGYPTYNFANVVDDHLMDITHVVRGNEYLTSTPKYCRLYDAFGWEQPIYVHLPSIINMEGKKLSKRNNDASYNDLSARGYLPEAIVNYLALLGWSPEDNVEIFSLEELTKKFSIERISKAPSVFDIEKLKWVNSKYINELSDEEYLNLVIPFVQDDLEKFSDEHKIVMLNLYKKQLTYGAEIKELINDFLVEATLSDDSKEFMLQDGIKNTVSIFKDEINAINEWSIDNIKLAIENTKNKADVKGKMLFMPIRICATLLMHGPDLAESVWLTGKESVLVNIEKIISL